MNDYFCNVGKSLRDKIKPQTNLLSNDYMIVENTTRFDFMAIDAVAAKNALSK